MSREGYGLLRFVSSDDGTRCAAECPALDIGWGTCRAHGVDVTFDGDAQAVRPDACIAAEQAAASLTKETP